MSNNVLHISGPTEATRKMLADLAAAGLVELRETVVVTARDEVVFALLCGGLDKLDRPAVLRGPVTGSARAAEARGGGTPAWYRNQTTGERFSQNKLTRLLKARGIGAETRLVREQHGAETVLVVYADASGALKLRPTMDGEGEAV